jgi:hypothetical protein
VTTIERVRAGRGALARCVTDPDAFVGGVFGARAEVGAAPGGFEDLLSLDDVDRFLTTSALRTPYLRLVKAGERIAEAAYTRSARTGSRDVAGIADPARVAALFEDGATIVLQGLHRWSEPVARFCRDLELELGHPCQVNAYVTPPGAQGLDLHDDPHDVLVLQAFGRKRWEVHTAPREAARPALDVTLVPGDTIYLPSGTPHAARAQQELSGHLTVGIHVTPWRDVVGAVVRDVLAADADEVPAGWTDDVPAFASTLRDKLATAAERLAAVDAAAYAERRRDRFLSTRPQLARGTVAGRSRPLEIDDATVVVRRGGSFCEVHERDGRIEALLGDRLLELPAWLGPAMRRIEALGEGEPLTVGDLSTVVPDPASRAVLVRRLVREALLATRTA